MDKNILQRYIEGDLTPQEKEDVAEWLDTDEKNMHEFLLLRNIYDATLWNDNNAFGTIENTLDSDSKKHKKKSKKIIIAQEVIKIAAVFLIAFGCYYLFMSERIFSPASDFAMQTVYVPEGQRAELILADGTKVWLNSKSQLTFPSHFTGNDRIVELNGEAYFDVTHDKEKKFTVKTKVYDIKVHGTEFNVNAYGNSYNFETSLIEGSVEVFSKCTNQSILLTPNTKVYAKNNELVTGIIENTDQFLWKKGIIYFENLMVDDILNKLELYYDVNIDVRNKELYSYRYTGKFRTTDGIDHVLKVLQLRHDFVWAKDSMNNIIIY